MDLEEMFLFVLFPVPLEKTFFKSGTLAVSSNQGTHQLKQLLPPPVSYSGFQPFFK